MQNLVEYKIGRMVSEVLYNILIVKLYLSSLEKGHILKSKYKKKEGKCRPNEDKRSVL